MVGSDSFTYFLCTTTSFCSSFSHVMPKKYQLKLYSGSFETVLTCLNLTLNWTFRYLSNNLTHHSDIAPVFARTGSGKTHTIFGGNLAALLDAESTLTSKAVGNITIYIITYNIIYNNITKLES